MLMVDIVAVVYLMYWSAAKESVRPTSQAKGRR